MNRDTLIKLTQLLGASDPAVSGQGLELYDQLLACEMPAALKLQALGRARLDFEQKYIHAHRLHRDALNFASTAATEARLELQALTGLGVWTCHLALATLSRSPTTTLLNPPQSDDTPHRHLP